MSEEALPIEDYGVIGDCRAAALVGRNGSIDWLCWPHFDSDACFAALLGTSDNGRWLLAATDAEAHIRRRYVDDTMIVETLFETETGSVALIDFMPMGSDTHSIIRRVEGRSGRVDMCMHLLLRFEYGMSVPWVTRRDDAVLQAIAGANRVTLRSGVELRGDGRAIAAEFAVSAGEEFDFVLCWSESHLPPPEAPDASEALAATDAFWTEWAHRCQYRGPWRAPVLRSLLTLKALTFNPTGALVAAPTTSLPEKLGGQRNWDYRYCWLRDATLVLIALMGCGYTDEAKAWRDWCQRAIAGDPEKLQIMYGLRGERRLSEWSPDWLPGYQGASPVRIGNAASKQIQLDIYGEVIGAMHIARRCGLTSTREGWELHRQVIEHLETIWEQPDDGIWEMRGGRRHFTHSKVMAWSAVNTTIVDAEENGLEGPLDRWRELRARMHDVICTHGFDAERNTFTQSFGSPALDASLLLIPQVRFLPADDPRIVGTVKAIEQALLFDGLVLRYQTDGTSDGLPQGEGAFLPCSFWLASVYHLQGRYDESRALFERLLKIRNDVGLLSEEFDPKAGRQIGNFPQAYSHLALIVTALTVEGSPLTQAKRQAA